MANLSENFPNQFQNILKRQIEFVIVTTSYNNEYWCFKNLSSIAEQTYPHFTLRYVDDASTDRTHELVSRLLERPELKSKSTLIRNNERRFALANIYDVIHSLKPHQIVVTLDGDDWFAHPKVLERVAQEYENRETWITYGSFDTNPPGVQKIKPIADEVMKDASFRTHEFVGHNLRTFYAKLFQLIKKEDLLIQGRFFPMAWDMAFMFPMWEMASQGHVRFIPDLLYIYNLHNPLNDRKIHPQLLVALGNYIRTLPPYKPLEKLF